MKYKMIINGRFPSNNEFIKVQRGNRYAGNKMKQEYQRICEWHIRKSLKGVRFQKPVRVSIICYEERQNRDLDNIASFFFKVFLDAMVRCQVIKNDNIKNVIEISGKVALDRSHPRIEIIVEEYENG